MVKKILGQCYIWLILLFMYIPIFVLIAYSFTTSKNVGVWTGFSFDLYVELWQHEKIMIALGNTLIIAITSALVSTLLGTLGAIGAFYSSKRTRKAFDNVTQLPIANAEIVMALSVTVMFVFFGSYVFKTNLFSYWTLLIGHVVLSIPFVYISVKPKLQQMDPSLYEAAIDLGATPSQALRKVIIPETIPGIFSGFLLAITLSLDDVVITEFTRGPGLLSGDSQIDTLSTYIQSVIKKSAIPPQLRALTTIIFLLVVLGVIGVTVSRYIKERKLNDQRRRKVYGK